MAEDEFIGRTLGQRAFARGSVSIPASIREHGGGRQMVQVIDLSQAGFRMQSASFIIPERAIFLTLPDYAPLKAHIAWRADNMYGCEFVQRLHEAIFDDILRRYPQLENKDRRP